MDNLLNKQIFMMTGSELLELLKMHSSGNYSNTVVKDFTDKKYVFGLNGIAKIFNCGRTKAQEIKNSGKIDAAIYQTGKKIVVDSEKALELMKLNSVDDE